MPVFWWVELDLVLLMDRALSDGVFWGVCELAMTLGSLSADGWACVLVLLVVWHEVSSIGACGQLGEARSWIRDGDLWENSCQLIFPEAGNSLVVQHPELSTPTAESQAQSPTGEPRPRKLHVTTIKGKNGGGGRKQMKTNPKTNNQDKNKQQ